jgi:hypothetical protein
MYVGTNQSNIICMEKVVSCTEYDMSFVNGAVQVIEWNNNFLTNVVMFMECPIRIPRPVKYTQVQMQAVNYVQVRSSLSILNVFFCTDATELSGQFGITAAEYYRIPEVACRPRKRPRSVIFFAIFLKFSGIN